MNANIKSPLKHLTIPTNGINLHVVQAGPDDGQLVILLHGFPEFWYGWHKQIDHLTDLGYKLWIPDQRGYNLSDKPKGISSYKVEQLVADVIGLIDYAGEENIPLIGHDWGGIIAWYTALLHPERITRLATLNAPHPHVFERAIRTSFRQFWNLSYAWFFQLPKLPEWILSRNKFQGAVNSLKNTAMPTTFSADELEVYRQAYAQPHALPNMINWYRALIQRSRPELKNVRLSMPTMILWGADDHNLRKQMAQPSRDLCDKGDIRFVPNATHWIQHDAPHLVSLRLGEFLNAGKSTSTEDNNNRETDEVVKHQRASA